MRPTHSISCRLSVQKVISNFLFHSPPIRDLHVMVNIAVYQRESHFNDIKMTALNWYSRCVVFVP